MSVQSTKAAAMGFDGGLTTYLNTSKTLGDILGSKLSGMELKADSVIDNGDGTYQDQDGNPVDQNGYLLSEDGKKLYGLTINGVEIGRYTEDTSLETILNDINSNSEAGVEVSFSKTTNQFNLTAKETGSAGKIEIAENGLAGALFGKVNKTGDDAVFTATINGKTTTYTRSSNTVELDGLTVTLEGKFDAVYKTGADGKPTTEIDGTQGVTFTSKTDTDAIVDVIKQMITDYNSIVTEVKKAYTDMPLQKSDGSKYEPLTAEDEADMTESEIKAYEEKAKTGILFMDRELSSLYSALRGAVVGDGDPAYLREIGISTSYEEGLTTITLDENKLRQALETDLDGVRDAFTKSGENGNGLMASIQEVTDRYASTTGATKGILIEKAGSKYAATSALNNTMQEKLEDLDEQIARWQDKMSNKVDYYTNKFTQLEVLINQMNSQSSALAGLTGGY